MSSILETIIFNEFQIKENEYGNVFFLHNDNNKELKLSYPIHTTNVHCVSLCVHHDLIRIDIFVVVFVCLLLPAKVGNNFQSMHTLEKFSLKKYPLTHDKIH